MTTPSNALEQGEPLMILKLKENSSEVEVVDDALDKISQELQSSGSDYVSIISVMGEYRTGKSFLLGFLLRFLRKKKIVENEMREAANRTVGGENVDDLPDFVTPNQDDEEQEPIPILDDYLELKGRLHAKREATWSIGQDDNKSKKDLAPWIREVNDSHLPQNDGSGFTWKHGEARCTTGIWLWSKPFVFPDRNDPKRKVGVLLMDTQGAWDSTMTRKQSGTIFGLTALLSSKLVYNLQKKIQERDFDNLDYITTYTQTVCKEVPGKDCPFGHLQVLVRDWSNYDDGFTMEQCREAMAAHMDKHLNPEKVPDDQKEKVMRLKEVFKSVSCYGLTRPAYKIDSKGYDGNLDAIENDFFQLLDDFTQQFFGEGFPQPSAPLGCEITADKFKQTVLNFAGAFQDSQDMTIGLREAFVNVQLVSNRDALLKEFKARFTSLAPPSAVVDPDKLDVEATKLRNDYVHNFARVLKPWKMDPKEEERTIDEFKESIANSIAARAALNNQALEGANMKIVASPVVGCGAYFLCAHHIILYCLAGVGAWFHFKKRSQEKQAPMYDPEVVKGVGEDIKAFCQRRYTDAQAIQVALNRCKPEDAMSTVMHTVGGLERAISAQPAQSNDVNSGNRGPPVRD